MVNTDHRPPCGTVVVNEYYLTTNLLKHSRCYIKVTHDQGQDTEEDQVEVDKEIVKACRNVSSFAGGSIYCSGQLSWASL